MPSFLPLVASSVTVKPMASRRQRRMDAISCSWNDGESISTSSQKSRSTSESS